MKRLYSRALTACLAVAPCYAMAAEFDGSSAFTCASIDVMECLPVEGCKSVSADAVDIPRFIRVDAKKKQITTGSADDQRKTAIERMEKVEGKLMMQGAESGREGQEDGIAWSLAITEDKGDMVLTASGEGVAFVIFGACTSL